MRIILGSKDDPHIFAKQQILTHYEDKIHSYEKRIDRNLNPETFLNQFYQAKRFFYTILENIAEDISVGSLKEDEALKLVSKRAIQIVRIFEICLESWKLPLNERLLEDGIFKLHEEKELRKKMDLAPITVGLRRVRTRSGF